MSENVRPLDQAAPHTRAMRLDKFLWFARLAKSRSAAQAIAASGHLRINSRPIDRAHVSIRTGQIIAFPQGPRVRILRIESLPLRRGPAPEAVKCYTDLVVADTKQEASVPVIET